MASLNMFPQQRESKTCFHSNESMQMIQDSEHSEDSRRQLSLRVSSIQSSELMHWIVQSAFLVEQFVSVILGCNYDFYVFNKSIKVIWNPLFISDVTIHITIYTETEHTVHTYRKINL
jgi:hypothetical protein